MNGQGKLLVFDDKFKDVQNLFDQSVVNRHLTFLKAFRRIAQSLDQNFVVRDKNTGVKGPSPPVREYLSKAVYRYHAWITKCLRARSKNEILADNELPPLDVLFILHAHMIAPSRFNEDTAFHFPELGRIGRFPLQAIASRVDVETGHYNTSVEQAETWERSVNLPFDPSAMSKTLDITCPSCNKAVSVSWVASEQAQIDGNGYGELGFSVKCSCGLLITHDTLATQKFIKDLQENTVAGTLLVTTDSVDGKVDNSVTRELVRILGDPYKNLGERLSWSMATVTERLMTATDCTISKPELAEMLRSYNHSSPFSTDLVYKALLQADFGTRLGSRGLLDQSQLVGNKEFLPAPPCFHLYRSFLKLTLVPDMPRIFPSAPVDLVWHTHQLIGAEYKLQVLDLVGVFVDHISMEQIAPTENEFELARVAWRDYLIAEGLVKPEDRPNCGIELQLGADGDPPPCTASGSQLFRQNHL